MTKHTVSIAKADKEDFENVKNLLDPMERLFNNNWRDEDDWVNWSDDNKDKQELLAIRKEIAIEERYSEEDVDNRLILFEFIKHRMQLCNCSNWQRVVVAAECLIETFCDPQDDSLSWRPDLERAMDYTMLGE